MKRLFLFLLVISALVQVACKKNSSSGPPVVTGVRTPNPAMADSTFTQALPGTLIVIEGHGLSGLQAVYFNDTAAYFNPVYATDKNVIVSIPTYAQTAATKPTVPSTIKLVTNHGTTTYSFTLVLSAPVIYSVALDSTGTMVTITGANFNAIQKITFPVPGNNTAPSYTVDTAHKVITAMLPSGTPTKDSLRVYCLFGTASFPYPPPMVISSVSNENALAGNTITIQGSNFIAVSGLTFPGGIAATNLNTVNVTKITAVVPAGITAPDVLKLTNVVGTVASPQLFDSYITHPSPGYLSTFDGDGAGDNTGFVGWTGSYLAAPNATYPGGTGSAAYIVNAGALPGNTPPGGNLGNPGFIQLNAVPWTTNTGASAAGYSLKFEIYVAAPWKAGEIWIMVGGWYGWQHQVARYAPWQTAPGGVFQPSGWVTATIPLNQFVNPVGAQSVIGYGGKLQSPVTDASVWDYGSFPVGATVPGKISDFGGTAVCFTIVNDQATPSVPANQLNFAIDNVRIVQGQ